MKSQLLRTLLSKVWSNRLGRFIVILVLTLRKEMLMKNQLLRTLLSKIWSNRLGRVISILVLMGFGFLAYYGDYFDGRGEWVILSRGEVTLIGVDGERFQVQVAKPMLSDDVMEVQDWLVSKGFAFSEAAHDSSATVYSKQLGMTFGVIVRIEPDRAGEGPEVFLSWSGHGFKRMFDEHIKETQALSNELVKSCARTVM